MSDGESKNRLFSTDFKNVHVTLVQSAPKKSYAKKISRLPVKKLNWHCCEKK
jgi:hypothetical protein